VAIGIFVLQNKGKRFNQIKWVQGLIYLSLLSSLAVSFTPQVDHETKLFAHDVVFSCIALLAFTMGTDMVKRRQ
jgi:hypothetical protein